MKEWKLDPHTSEDIIHSIADTAANYTPEWNFDLENPDIGSALAYVYADMMEDTIRQLGRVGYKNQLAFFNSLGAGLRDAAVSRGYAVLGLVQDAPDGTEVDAYTGMTADLTEEEGGAARFETREDLYVTPAYPTCLYLTDGRKDSIYQLSDNLQEQSDSITLFRRKGENLQKHEFYLAHDEVLRIQGESDIEIGLYTQKGRLLEEKILKRLADPKAAVFSYWTGEEWQEFSEVSVLSGRLMLHKTGSLAAAGRMQAGESETYVVRCRVKDIDEVGKVSVEEIMLKGKGAKLLPQYIYGASIECSQSEFFPFGERMNLYEEVYFGSEEVLTKRGAQVSLSFQMDFVQIPLENPMEEQPFEWKWVMKRSEFRPDPEYDITIEEVIWEYFNGTGWSRLFPEKEYGDIFSARFGVLNQQKTLTFICPEDIAPILVNACETCYIRARILKMNNLYKLKGKYITPVISNPLFSYHYKEMGRHPQMVGTENNLERRLFGRNRLKNANRAICILEGLSEEEKSMYLGFERPPAGSPIRMLWVMEDTLTGERGSISWEYENQRGFQEMNLADLTNQLSRTGSVTFAGRSDFRKTSHFGQEMYWIRLRDESGFYSDHNVHTLYPVLKKLWMNVVEIRHMEREETELFTLDYYEEDCSFSLLRGNIDEISVEVLEDSEEEAHWVVWEEVPALETQLGGKRVYEVDRINGVLRFGNGSHGRVPPFGKPEGIRAHYKCGGGSKGNVQEGQVNKLNQTVGFVSSVYNPIALWGGLDVESATEALKRCGAKLRHWDRAVTARDYEELAVEAARILQKVRCFGGRNDKGEKESGAVTLVVYPKNYQGDKNIFYAVQEDIFNYLGSRMDQGILNRGQFYIVEPKLVEIQVRAEITVGSFQDIFKVRRKVQERVQLFLDPVKGHFDGNGWNIGQLPNAMQLQNILKEIPEIVWISKVYLMTFINGPKGKQEVELTDISKHPYVLPTSGNVEVVVTVQPAVS